MIAEINGIHLCYTDEGKGIPLVLLHGGPGAYDYKRVRESAAKGDVYIHTGMWTLSLAGSTR